MSKELEDQIEVVMDQIQELETRLSQAKKELSQLVKQYSWSQGFITPLRPDHMRTVLQRRKNHAQKP